MGITKILIKMTRADVPTIIGMTPAVLMLNMSCSVPAVTKRQLKPSQPSSVMLPRITARIARISSVARPVTPEKKKEIQSRRPVSKLWISED